MNLKLKQWIDGRIGRALAAIHVILVRAIGLLLNRNHSIDKVPENILVIKMLGLGSVIMASDSIYSLKQKYPQAKLILMCGKGVAAGVQPLQLFDEIWIHDDSNIFKLVTSGIQLMFKSWKLKKLWVIDLEVYSVLTTLFSAYTLAINRFGFQLNKVHFRNYLNTHNVYFNQFITVTQNYQNLVFAAGVKEIKPFKIKVEPTEPINLKKYIAINNTCSDLGGNLRKLPDDLLKTVCEYLLNHTDYLLAFTGAPSDKAAIESFLQINLNTYKQRVLNIAGMHTFDAYYAFLQHNCKLMISIDSAPLHIAMKLGLPTYSLWGPIQPNQRFNFNKQSKHRHYYLGTPCSPCIHLSDVVPCGGDNICMKQMSTSVICNNLIEMLHEQE